MFSIWITIVVAMLFSFQQKKLMICFFINNVLNFFSSQVCYTFQFLFLLIYFKRTFIFIFIFIFWVFGCLFYDKTWEKEMGVLHLGKWEFWILFSFFSNGKFPNKYYTYIIGKERHEIHTRPIRLGRG